MSLGMFEDLDQRSGVKEATLASVWGWPWGQGQGQGGERRGQERQG